MLACAATTGRNVRPSVGGRPRLAAPLLERGRPLVRQQRGAEELSHGQPELSSTHRASGVTEAEGHSRCQEVNQEWNSAKQVPPVETPRLLGEAVEPLET